MDADLVVRAADTFTPRPTIEYTFWFKLDGTVPLEAVSKLILDALSEAQIPGIDGEFRSPFAKEYAE